MRNASFSILIAAILLGLISIASGQELADADDSSAAVEILRGLENTRMNSKPFRIKGVLRREHAGSDWNCGFVAECEGKKYRISRLFPSGKVGAVAVFDGEQLFSYDGRKSATISQPNRRAASALAFDPRTLGLSTGLYSDLTLQENLAFRTGSEIRVVPPEKAAPQSDIVRIELTDRFAQTIRFDLQPHGAFRIHYYAKTIPVEEGSDVFAQYVTETEYWPDEDKNWIPRKLTMYSLEEGNPEMKYDNMTVEFEKPEFVAEFDPEIWTVRGLHLPFGQPLADLRIKQRVGYWDGQKLVQTAPRFELAPPSPPRQETK